MKSFNNHQIDELLKQEWLVSNGIGGYAASSICWANTCRNHGLLVVNSANSSQKRVLLSKIEECLSIHRDTCIEFSTNQYPGVIHPQGYQYLHSFIKDPLPKTIFRIENQEVSKSIFMVHGSNSTVLEYHNTGQFAYQLSLMPLFVDRSNQELFYHNKKHDFYCEQLAEGFKIHSHNGSEPLYLGFPKGAFCERRQWFHQLEYRKDQRKGLDFQEDAFALGWIRYYLQPGEKAYLVISTDRTMLGKDPELLKLAAIERLNNLMRAKPESALLADVLEAV